MYCNEHIGLLDVIYMYIYMCMYCTCRQSNMLQLLLLYFLSVLKLAGIILYYYYYCMYLAKLKIP